jgi:hypothetical protein
MMVDMSQDVIIELLIKMLGEWDPDYYYHYAFYEQLPQTIRMKIDGGDGEGCLEGWRLSIAGSHGYDPLPKRIREQFGYNPIEGARDI